MKFGIKELIIAIITTNKEFVDSSTAPVFIAQNEEEKERIALLVSKTTMGMVHDIGHGTYIIVKH
ncbi:capping complex subunit for YIEGIA [Serpentinicella alkaliphila]|uniref:Uncharacterized protein n=1 Tax=Serpentinicella alkaliphila TaxID=1734049 RepID=A0A4R2TNW6_9FIRM|nr:hypothetical protein [Serpentinicella alkaliphila]QUH26085.1 hypothetical protein HZR23_10285 [Serpentinicella alkaliphila]TCP99098.1 hypothetical protein EDD79_103626 [Serpentinicella alkaliphila]